MKRTLKTLLALMLAAVTVMTCTAAFAAEENGKLLWEYYDSEYTYDIAGEITTGVNTLTSPEDSYYFCYEFNVEESGYYTIGFSDHRFDGWIGIPEEINGFTAKNEAEYLFYSGYGEPSKYTYKLDEGKTYICFDAYTQFENEEFEIIYQGETVESIEYEGSLLLNRDIYFYDETCDIYADASVTFSSGNTTIFSYICATAPDEYKEGTNTFRYSYFGESVDFEADVIFITEIIKDVEISNLEDYLNAKIYYDGHDMCLPVGETVTFTFSDGSKAESVYYEYGENYVTLPDGSEIYYYIYTLDDGYGNITLYVDSAGETIKAFDCEETKASTDENLLTLLNNEKYNLSKVSKYIRQSLIALLDCDSFEELTDYGFGEWGYNIQIATEYFLSLFAEITSLIYFYVR
ncbi:MAG: hypothetical protein IKU08_03650 [Clostridia bacterium]|nr:hypothetical protein [Clostridia bacterium]